MEHPGDNILTFKKYITGCVAVGGCAFQRIPSDTGISMKKVRWEPTGKNPYVETSFREEVVVVMVGFVHYPHARPLRAKHSLLRREKQNVRTARTRGATID